MVRLDAQILVGADAKIISATGAAVELLGLSLDELKALPPGGLSLEEDRAASAGFEEAWHGAGRGPIMGTGTVRLLDKTLIRVRYLITPQPDGTFEILLDRSRESTGQPPRIYTLGGVLSAWRAAERKLAAVSPDNPEWATVQEEIEHFRSEYQRLAHRDSGGPAPLAAEAG